VEHTAGGDDLEIWAATTTPFTSDGKLDPAVVREQARHLVATGVDGAFVGGSTGEFPSLTTAERLELLDAWADHRTGPLRLGFHVGHTSVAQARRLAARAAERGVELIAAVAPFYGQPTSVEALVDALGSVAEAAPDTPFCYYHFPAATGLAVPASTVVAAAAARIPTLRAVKFTDGDLEEFVATQQAAPPVRVYFGKDELLPAAVACGARAVIGSLYNFLAPVARTAVAHLRAGELDRAMAAHRPFREVARVARAHGSIAVVKELANRFGPDAGPPRPPWHGLGGEAMKAVDRLADELVPLLRGRDRDVGWGG
jgi:N-acetylneuraminate lyase